LTLAIVYRTLNGKLNALEELFATRGISLIPESASGAAPIFIQRIIGLPGDTLEMHFGDLLVNGKSDSALAERKIVPGPSYLNADGPPAHGFGFL
jgi:hypothetical protein